MSDTHDPIPEDDQEPVIKVDKRKTRRQKREEEAAASETPAVEVEATPAETEPAEVPPEPQAATPDEAQEAATPEEQAPEVDPFEAVNVYEHLHFLVRMFIGQAWVHLGLQAPPGASETRTDLPQARLAIDMVVVIKDKLGDHLSAAEKDELEMILSNLRVNYLRRQSA